MKQGAKRTLALAVAAVMVLGSLAIRNTFGDGEDGGSSNGHSTNGRSRDAFRLTCASELRQVCSDAFGKDDKIVLKFEDPGRTADALVKLKANSDPGFDGWLAPGPWDDIVADNRRFSKPPGGPLLGKDSGVLARSPVVMVMMSDAIQAQVSTQCGEPVTWTCLVGHVQGTPGGTLRLGVPDLERGDGLAVITSAVNQFFKSTDYSATDLDQGGFSPFFEDLTRLSNGAKLGRRTLLQAARAEKGKFSVVGTLEAETAMLSRKAAEDLTVLYPEPIVTADVRLSTPEGSNPNDALGELNARRLAKALARNGWRVEGEVPLQGVNGAKELPTTSNMPSPGVLQQLRNEWAD
ncbi:MAG TPA: hypothetical protein VL068_10140 [Microthrixaceae bacterium]|nr:hypothetical protein [Microthrixaceae bacterium]